MSNASKSITSLTASRLHLGAAYYPEHWPEARWPEDIRLMNSAGLTVVRMGEFAWSALEPAEGEFDLDWLERAVELLAEAGIASVLGTPTAVPPAWLVQKYPDILASGRKRPPGPVWQSLPLLREFTRFPYRLQPNRRGNGQTLRQESPCDRLAAR